MPSQGGVKMRGQKRRPALLRDTANRRQAEKGRTWCSHTKLRPFAPGLPGGTIAEGRDQAKTLNSNPLLSHLPCTYYVLTLCKGLGKIKRQEKLQSVSSRRYYAQVLFVFFNGKQWIFC